MKYLFPILLIIALAIGYFYEHEEGPYKPKVQEIPSEVRDQAREILREYLKDNWIALAFL